ncbi:MAG: 1-acyl-sn-glycerol-3-phosphate acyltransferase [Alphaproteobacteria bacterium]|nr:1-acyl-sn-glycerol-3-phosphate acyltransferase [Alphaproteobacteria bacterium]
MTAPPPPTPQQRAVLQPMERAAFSLADLFVRHLGFWAKAWNSTFMIFMTWAASSRRMRITGLHHVADLPADSRVVLVANHRSFFDFFQVMAVTFRHTRLSRRVLFPVRSTFFYDHPLGPPLNLLMSGMSMFPPILRSREGMAFNEYALERLVAELQLPGTVVGIHPEGTRNKTGDPYRLTRLTRGVGLVALQCPDVLVIPIFVLGASNDLFAEMRKNFGDPANHPLDVVFGPPVDFGELRDRPEDPKAWKAAARRCADAIEALGAQQRALSPAEPSGDFEHQA